MNRLTEIDTPYGRKRLHYATPLIALRQIAKRNHWHLAVRRGRLIMEGYQHA
ncbi:hypothetical protein SAMN05661010_02552 [Modicisalibacter muralis]|uniref:Uncharacterized protein n=1 Tax=Modicisalibacter muralis TaxID=119000 RepID=A0A1G9MX21_9GAMM|nr:hypothetical protein [Halomonas muralis]SDL78684.1 hypothetical protein SAMN05661010_02552 [Halomonas muralis]